MITSMEWNTQSLNISTKATLLKQPNISTDVKNTLYSI